MLIVDFGGKFSQLIARRVRDLEVYCEIVPYTKAIEAIEDLKPSGLILTGGFNNVDKNRSLDPKLLNYGLPILGLGFGHIALAKELGGKVTSLKDDNIGEIELNLDIGNPLFNKFNVTGTMEVDSTEIVTKLPEGFKTIGTSLEQPIVAMANNEAKIYGLQAFPKFQNSELNTQLFKNFLFDIVGCSPNWTMEKYAKDTIEKIQAKVGNKKVLLGLSGGVDSSVCAKLINDAIGSQLTCIFVDHGLMRKNEAKEVLDAFKDSGMKLVYVDAEQRFLSRLEGVSDPEKKRKIIGEEFIRVFEEEGRKIGTVDFLAQGTIYPDIIESGVTNGQIIKSHHNVGGLPSVIDFKEIIEPLTYLFKDEVRELGRVIGLDEVLVSRQPFPGPGLAVRVIGEITKDKLDILREADYIFREELVKAGLDKEFSQYFAVLTDNRSVGVKDAKRTYDYTLALRAVVTSDFMTATWGRIPHDVLDIISRRITTEVDHINRIVYDITDKPPGTIEWE